MKWKPSRNVIENARRVFPKMLAKYLKQGRKAVDGERSPEELHKFRIKTKRFRYTAELFRPVYGDALAHELEPVKEIQTVLGKLHDYHIIAETLEGTRDAQAKLDRLTKKKRKEFQEQWAAFDSDDRPKQWESLLAAEPEKSSSAPSKRSARKGSGKAARRAGTKVAGRLIRTTLNITAA